MSSIITRRGLVGGLVGIIAAPAIVRASSLMPVKAIFPAEWEELAFTINKTVTGMTIVTWEVIAEPRVGWTKATALCPSLR